MKPGERDHLRGQPLVSIETRRGFALLELLAVVANGDGLTSTLENP